MDLVTIERQPPLRIAQLRAGKHNALTGGAVEALHAALAADEEAPVLVLFGSEDAFCVGLDNATLGASAPEREGLLAAMGALLQDAIAGPTRIVAACAGHAVAAGAMLLLVSDLRIGTSGRYKIGFTEPGLGMPLPELPALLARERLDRRRLHELAALGRIVGPEEARDAGFLDTLIAPDRLREVALERAREIAALSERAYRGSVAAVWGASLKRIETLVRDQARRYEETLRDGS